MTIHPTDQFSLTYQPEDYGVTRIDLLADGQPVSNLWVTPMLLRVGEARILAGGIGGVWTHEQHRKRNYARRLLEATITWLENTPLTGTTGGGRLADVSLLWGIPFFYEKFGYAQVMPEVYLYLTELSKAAPLPEGWNVRVCEPRDVPAIQALYERATAGTVGAVVRQPDERVWVKLAEIANDPQRDECRVVEAPDGRVVAYAWRGRDFWPVHNDEGSPDALPIGEACAEDHAAAEALLAACRAWAIEEAVRRPTVKRAELAVRPYGLIHAAAMRQHARLEMTWWPSGECMARTMHFGRLLTALHPELTRRVQAARLPAYGTLRLVTDRGTVMLHIAEAGVMVLDAGVPVERTQPPLITVEMPQSTLIQLVFGAYTPADLLDRLATPPEAHARAWLETLFPQRMPYLHLPDWV